MSVFRGVCLLSVPAVLLACSGTTVTNNYVNLTGGSSSTGGSPQTTTGGLGATGGSIVASGGAIAVGGETGSSTSSSGGGVSGSGGASVAVGGSASGGTSAMTTATGGGQQASGGSNATSTTSTVAVGGTNSGSGGAATGGLGSSGGTTSATGGAMPTGGITSATGGSAAGGAAATGGTTAGGNGGLLSNCELLLHMDEGAWNGTSGEASDSSGAGNHGVAVSGVTTGTRAKFGRSGLFDGSGYVSVADSATLHAGAAFTVSAWVYPTGLNGSSAPGIVSKRIAYGSGAEFTLFAWTNNSVYVDIDGEGSRFSSTAVLANNAWYHIVMVFDGSQSVSQRASLYINGQLDSIHAVESTSVAPSSATVHVGDLPSGGDKFIGSIDEVAFWQRALGATEVSAVYQRTSAL